MRKLSAIIALILSLSIFSGCDRDENVGETGSETYAYEESVSENVVTEAELFTGLATESESETSTLTEVLSESACTEDEELSSEPLTETYYNTETDWNIETDENTETYGNAETDHSTETEIVYETTTATESETANTIETEEHVHVFGDWTVDRPASCSEGGRDVRVCDCGAQEERSSVMLEHNFGLWKQITEATCTVGGEYERECACGETEKMITDKLDHDFGDWTLLGDPGCLDERQYSRSCKCGAEENKSEAPLGHIEILTPAKLPTETEEGYTEKITCQSCGDVLKASVSVAALTVSEVDILADVTYEGNKNGILTFHWKTTEEYTDKLLGMNVSVTNDSKVIDYKVFDHDETWEFEASGNLVRFTFTFMPVTVDGVQGNSFVKQFYWFPDSYNMEFPRLEVYTLNGELPTFTKTSPPSGAWGGGITDANYVQSKVSLYNNDNTLLYTSESSGYEGAKIKVRGNTSAYTPKQPFKIKLSKKFDLLGGLIERDPDVDYRNKDWVLLKSGYSSNVAVGSTVSELVGNEWTPQYSYVTLFVNGEYRGLYILIESIDQDEARCDVSDSGYIVEFDAYWWNEPLYFTTPISENRGAKPTFKYPDVDELTAEDERVVYIQQYLTDLENVMLGNAEGDINDYLDMRSFVKWMMTHDILASWDSGGSNMYMLKYDNTADSKMRMGPVWDYDSIYWSREKFKSDTFARLRYEGHFYMHYLVDDTEFLKIYREEYDVIRNQIVPAVDATLDKFKTDTYVKLLSYEKSRWGGTYDDPMTYPDTVLAWFDEHLSWMDENVDTPYGVVAETESE